MITEDYYGEKFWGYNTLHELRQQIFYTLLSYLSWRPQAGRLVISDSQAADTLNVNKCVFVPITHI